AHDHHVPVKGRTKTDHQVLAVPHHYTDSLDVRPEALDQAREDGATVNLQHGLGQTMAEPGSKASRCDYSVLNRLHSASASWTTNSASEMAACVGLCTPPNAIAISDSLNIGTSFEPSPTEMMRSNPAVRSPFTASPLSSTRSRTTTPLRVLAREVTPWHPSRPTRCPTHK